MLAFITSRTPEHPIETDLTLDPASSGFAVTGLRVSSTVRLHRLVTVASSVIARELGALSPHDQRRIDDALRRLFQL